MNIQNILFSVATSSLAIGLTCYSAAAATFNDNPLGNTSFSDTDFLNLKNQSKFEEDWVAEGRIGNNQNNGDPEQFIVNWQDNNTPIPVAQGQRTWTSGEAVPFIIQYDGTTVNYTLGGNNLTASNVTERGRFPTGLNSILLRGRATENSSLIIQNLVVDGTNYGSNFIANNNVNYLQIADVTENLNITGDVIFNWTGNAPRGSNLAFQFKFGSLDEDIPTPGTTTPEPNSILSLGVLASLFAASHFTAKKIN